ncbi:MAG: protein-disulfide reductase DsbD [Gammaproteobacteria bacterium]|nr:protein-disulfide reductase DsbD [Gammaproteobacteria bacterium]
MLSKLRSRALALVILSMWSGGAVYAHHGEETLLDEEQAYRLTTTVRAEKIELKWDVTAGYYIYQFQFSTDNPGIRVGTPRISGTDERTLGVDTVYRQQVTTLVPYTRPNEGISSFILNIEYRGCSDNGRCFEQRPRQVTIDLPQGQASSQSSVESPSPVSSLTKLLGINLGNAVGGADTEFLDPDQAFVLSAIARDERSIVTRWEIAEGYYLYKDKFTFDADGSDDVALGVPQLPPGKQKEDEFFGRMEVYYDEVAATLPVLGTPPGREFGLKVTYQGCADAGLCYPPITKTVSIALPLVADASAQDGDTETSMVTLAQDQNFSAEVTEQDRLARLLSSGSSWAILLTFYGFGLLLAFTPCVLPMVPILTSIIIGQGKNASVAKSFGLSLVYVLAMSVTYTAAGIVAGLFGSNLQAVFQQPWILITFSAVFVALALSMFGFYDLQLPQRWQTALAGISSRRSGGTFFGVAAMGLLSALIVGPCVAAPLAGALIYIGQSGDAVLGGAALFAMSLGMGTPLLVMGASAGKLLPRMGPWMNSIKVVFGVLLLGVAIYLIERIVPGWVTMLLWAALLIVTAIYMGAFDSLQAGAGGWRRFQKGAGLVVMAYGALLMVGAAGGGSDVFQPLKGVAFGTSSTPSVPEVHFKQVKGMDELRVQLDSATQQGKSVILDYYADWCISCKQMEKYTFSDPGVQAALANTVWLQTDVTANDEQDKEMLKYFNIYGPPAILFFNVDGQELFQRRIFGFMDAKEFRAHIVNTLG